MKCIAPVLVSLAVAFSLSGCSKAAPEKKATQLNIFIWSEYLPKAVCDQFTARTGIKVNVDTYDSNEALEAKLQSGAADYDLVVPSDYMVRKLIAQKLLKPLDHAALTNMKNLDARFLNKKFDPENKFTLPYFWGTTGFGFNKEKVKGTVDSWAVFFDEGHKGRILMLDDMRECFAVALKLMGKSLNEKDPAVLKQAADMLKKQKALVKVYDSADFSNKLGAGDVDLAHGYNGQIAKVVQEHADKLAYIVPKEGGTFWMDNICIPSSSRNSDAAVQFLNYILEPEVGAAIVNEMSYASANKAAQAKIKPEILKDSAIYPSDDVIARCEFIEDVGPETTELIDRLWTEIKAQ